jgi:hypothetical protein
MFNLVIALPALNRASASEPTSLVDGTLARQMLSTKRQLFPGITPTQNDRPVGRIVGWAASRKFVESIKKFQREQYGGSVTIGQFWTE